jgi:diaminopimelate epimerase
MKFVKAQTNGNDFVIVSGTVNDNVHFLKSVADRTVGVGCDQVIFVTKSVENCYRLTFFNQDGSSADMCGNGACAVAVYIKNVLGEKRREVRMLTLSGEYLSVISVDDVSIRFALPRKLGECIVSTGNLQYITSTLDIENVEKLAKEYEECNLHFVELLTKNSVKIKTFERGVGWTMACGSGAVAVAYFIGISGMTEIRHDGGKSLVEISDSHATLTTRPKLVFEGELYEYGTL